MDLASKGSDASRSVWPSAYDAGPVALPLRDTFTVLVRHLFRPVRRNDFRVFVHPPAAIVAAAQAQGLSVGYQHRALLWNLVGLERMAQPARLEPC